MFRKLFIYSTYLTMPILMMSIFFLTSIHVFAADIETRSQPSVLSPVLSPVSGGELNYELNDELYVGKNILFTAFVPDVTSQTSHIILPEFSDGVNFSAIRSYDYFMNGRRGLRIEVELSFAYIGAYDLPFVEIKTTGEAGEAYISVPFATIFVTENKSDLMPYIAMRFEKLDKQNNVASFLSEISAADFQRLHGQKIFSVNDGDTIRITVNVRHAKTVEDFSWKIPVHSILEQTEISDNFSVFEWTVFASGLINVPEFSASVTTYGDKKITVFSPPVLVSTFAATSQSATASSDVALNLSRDAVAPNSHLAPHLSNISHEECVSQAQRLSHKRQKTRVLFCTSVIFCALFFFAIAVFVAVYVFKRKKHIKIIACLIALFVLFFAASVFLAVRLSMRFGIFTGGNISAIPEESASQSVSLAIGEKVRVVRVAGKWCFVENETVKGWTLSSNVIFIE